MANSDKKRKAAAEAADSDSDGDSVKSTIDVEFEFFDLNPIDYHALKNLVSQLFHLRSPTSNHSDPASRENSAATDIDVGELADILLGERKEWVGRTVKCDGEESDPYGFSTVLDLRADQTKPSVQALTTYLISLISSPSAAPAPEAASLKTELSQLLSPQGTGVGLVMSERLVNLPVQLMPVLFRGLGEEIKHAQSKNAPGFAFSHLLVPSRVFLASAITFDELDAAAEGHTSTNAEKTKKKKKSKTRKAAEIAVANGLDPEAEQICLFHPEDEVISRFASHTVHYAFPSSVPTSERNAETFGVEQKGRLMLVELAKWEPMCAALEEYMGGVVKMEID